MPKTPSKTSKKKKFNSRFPPARIKKIMQTDEEVGKVAAAVPVIISRALELFLESLIKETSQTTIAKNAKTLSTTHIKHTIETNKQFDFLRDLVANLPDHNLEEGNGDTVVDNGDVPQKRKRGRPRKNKDLFAAEKHKKGESSKVSPDTSEEEDEADEEEEEEEDEATESDNDDKAGKPAKPPSYVPAKSSTSASVSILQSGASSSLPHTAAQYNSGPANATTAGAQNFPTQFPPGYSVPALSSISNQQKQLQAHHHQQPQQHGGLDTQPPKPSLHTNSMVPPSGMEGYPIPPQFHNPYQMTGLMPPAHQPLPLHLHPGPGSYPATYAGLHIPPDQGAVNSQAHPINLSMVAQRTSAANNADDYDS